MTLPSVETPAVAAPYPVGHAVFAPGQTVLIRAGAAPGHIRTPWYLRGRTGVIERICGAFPNPEELAYGRDGLPARVLYRVRVSMAEIWGADCDNPADTVDAEIFEHWLEAA
ncbi:MAG: SH3-like domain-containing protein [Pseudomonadota bacterium]